MIDPFGEASSQQIEESRFPAPAFGSSDSDLVMFLQWS